jgi:hypothetical protein
MANEKVGAIVPSSNTDGLLLSGVRLPANVMLPNGDTGFAVGSHLKTGFGVEGVVTEMRIVGNNVLISLEGGHRAVLFSSGMLGQAL